MTRWFGDLMVGIRLAVGGGRTSLARFVLTTVGIAIAVAVLLIASCVDNMLTARDQRQNATVAASTPIPGVDPLYRYTVSTEFQGANIQITHLYPSGPNSPQPPGLPRLPAPGEAFVSHRLAELLGSAGGDQLRPRFPEVAGEIDRSGVVDANDLIAYVGADASVVATEDSQGPYSAWIYSYGMPGHDEPIDPGLLLVVLLGVVALLVPVFIFVAASARIAGAERDRRLSALRLVGGGSRQVRRIAAAESLVGAVAGLLVGAGLFFVLRQVLGEVELFGVQIYPQDVVPAGWLVALMVLAVPVLALLTTQFALRRTIIEPLGVVRHQRPVRRRLWWRLALLGIGIFLLLSHGGVGSNDQLWSYSVAAGATAVLVSVPVLLPWAVERVVSRMRGGPPAWQLAVRRLQLDSGTSARVVGGVAVVLAGAIALQSVLLGEQHRYGEGHDHDPAASAPVLTTTVAGEVVDEVVAELRAVPDVGRVTAVQSFTFRYADGGMEQAALAGCADVEAILGITDCADGQMFVNPGMLVPGTPTPFPPGRALTMHTFSYADSAYRDGGTWTVPPAGSVRLMPPDDGRPGSYSGQAGFYASVLVTPSVLGGISTGERTTQVYVELGAAPGTADRALNALASFGWRVSAHIVDVGMRDTRLDSLSAVRDALLASSVIVLLMAGISLLALALEQIRERRRPLAVLAATGVPRATLARSLLWQSVVPIVLGTVIAVVIGLGLSALALRLTGIGAIPGLDAPMSAGRIWPVVDWTTIAVLSGAAVALGLLVSALTLPFLRSATRLSALRTE